MTEIQIVIVGQSHAAEYDLVYIRSQGHLSHHIVVRLVWICEKRDFLAGYQSIVQVDAGYTCRNQLRRLASLVRIDRRSSGLAFFPFYFRASVDRLSVSVEETSCKFIADLECRRLPKKCNFGIGRYTFRSCENLKRDQVSFCLHYLGEPAFHGGQLVIRYPFGLQ